MGRQQGGEPRQPLVGESDVADGLPAEQQVVIDRPALLQAVGVADGRGAGGRVGRGRRRVGRTGRGEEPEPVGPDRQLVPGPGGLPAGGPEGNLVLASVRLADCGADLRCFIGHGR